ncbi:MAG: WD40/YVTN/BNR-like repeat-containing protein [Actinomycetota bacterium]
MPTILVATRDGVHTLDDNGQPRSVDHAGRSVTVLGRAGEEFWAIVDASELWHAAGADWSHVTDLDDPRATCVAAIGADVFVGSSEARLFRLAGEALEPVVAFDHAEGRETWYTPWGGPPHTRSMANWDDDVYVNVHVGGIPRTDDGGETWTPTIDVDADVHHVTTAEGMVLAACAAGVAWSSDRGATWTYRTDGLEARYSRAVAVCGEAVLMSASNGPRGGRAAVYRGNLAGGTFERCRAGLPQWFDDNIDTYCLDALPDGSFAAFGTSHGRVYGSTDQGATWDERVSGLQPVHRVLVLP